MPGTTNSETTNLAENIQECAAFLYEMEDPDRAEAGLDALAQNLADAMLGSDGSALDAIGSSLQPVASEWASRDGSEAVAWAEQLGRLYALIDVARWAVERRGAEASAVSVEPDTLAHRMLLFLMAARDNDQVNNSGVLAQSLGVDKTQVSRTGRALIERGLASRRILGRKTFWELTPRGRYAVEQLGQAETEDRGPLAVALPDLNIDHAKGVAADLAAHGVTAYFLARLPVAGIGHSRSRSRPASVVVMHGARVEDDALDQVRKLSGSRGRHAVQLEVEALSSDVPAFSIALRATPSEASTRRRSDRPRAVRRKLPRQQAKQPEPTH